MNLIYKMFPIGQALSDVFQPELSWSHYCELIKIEDSLVRYFYHQEAILNNWSIRELIGLI